MSMFELLAALALIALGLFIWKRALQNKTKAPALPPQVTPTAPTPAAVLAPVPTLEQPNPATASPSALLLEVPPTFFEAFQDLLVATAESGLSDTETKSSMRLFRNHPRHAEAFRDVQLLHSSLEIAFKTASLETANSRIEVARECLSRIMSAPPTVIAPSVANGIRGMFEFSVTELATAKYLQQARAQRAKAVGMKTPKARQRHLLAARETIDLGLADAEADEKELINFLATLPDK